MAHDLTDLKGMILLILSSFILPVAELRGQTIPRQDPKKALYLNMLESKMGKRDNPTLSSSF